MKNVLRVSGLALPVMILFAPMASAQSVTFGLGYSDFSNEISRDTATVDLEYHHTPFYEGEVASYSWGGNARITGAGDFFVGAGIVANWSLANEWFIEGSLMPGYYDEDMPVNQLGGHFFFRSLIGVGKRFESGNSMSLGLSHISNASIRDFNPGVNTLSLRYTVAF